MRIQYQKSLSDFRKAYEEYMKQLEILERDQKNAIDSAMDEISKRAAEKTSK